MLRSRIVQRAAVALGWAALAIIGRVGGFLLFVRRRWYWAKVFVQRLRLRCGAAALADGMDTHNTNPITLRKGQHIIGADCGGTLADNFTVQTHSAFINQRCGQ